MGTDNYTCIERSLKVKRKLSLMMLVILLFIHIIPVYAQEPSFLDSELQSDAVILIEEETGRVLFEKNSNKKIYPASLTKILTALIAIEYLDPNEVITVGNEVYAVPLDASKAGHNPGDEITLKDLLISLLLPSGNDSAFVIACQVSKKATGNANLDVNGCIAHFAGMMNEKAKEFGLSDTHFVNPHGYHDENHYSTAHDIAQLTREALKNPLFKEIVKMPSAEIGTAGNPKEQKLTFKNRNLLLDSKNSETFYSYATGVKTGFTNEAGQCLVASAEKDGMSLIAVVLNNPTSVGRFKEAKTLLEYGFQNYNFQNIVNEGDTITTVVVEKAAPKGPSELELVAKNDFKELFYQDDFSRVEKSVTLFNEPIEAPIVKGQVIGEVSFILDGEQLGAVELIAKYDIQKRTILDLIFSVNAIPYWCGAVGIIFILVSVITAIKKKRKRRGLHFR